MVDQCVYVGGDNLDVMRNDLSSDVGGIDLIYLDPPFNSKKSYNCNFPGEEQKYGFDDVWNYLDHKAATDKEFTKIKNNDDKLAHFLYVVQEGAVKDSNHFAYLTMMASRLIEMHKLLKPTGSIYLHVDPTESHYLKIVMDLIFGVENFKNEIVWQYQPGSAPKDGFGRKHDIILRYSKTNKVYFNSDSIREPYSDKTLERLKHAGAREKNIDKVIERGGRIPIDVWYYPSLSGNAHEAMGYPTQKPEALLERIISSSCPTDGIVLDPFCGCGTSWAVAARKNIKYIGIDISSFAEEVITRRATQSNGSIIAPIFIPRADNPESATHMGEKDKHISEIQVVKKLGLTHSGKNGSDGGVDGNGIIVLKDGRRIPIVISVKSGAKTASHFRDFVGVVTWDRNVDRFGVFATRDPATKDMKLKISRMHKIDGIDAIQVLTIGEIFNKVSPKTIQLPEGAYIERTN